MEKTRAEMQLEIDMLRSEIKVAREASEITADFVVKQFEQTERMLHRFQSADSERQAVLDAATQLSIITTDLNGTIQLFSKGASTLLGYKPEEMVNQSNILSLHLEDELDHYGEKVSGVRRSTGSGLHDMEVFDQFVKQKQSSAQEWFYVCKDGTHLPVSLSVTSLYNPDGRIAGYLFTAMDMTLQKKMKRELIKSKELAESANASKGDFLARMSHEIRTPMNGIIGMTSLLQKTTLEPKQHGYTEKLLGSANSLLRLINDILDFSKIDAGKLQLEEVPFNLEDTLDNIATVVGMQAEKKGLEFAFQIDPQVSLNLIGDPLRLGQVLMNLASNAVKFTQQGEIVISVNLEKQVEDELEIRFSVRDSGIGLREEQIDNLFSAFTQADDSITRKYGGTGLGLAICKQLTKLMDGQIWAASEFGRGSEFIFTSKFRIQNNTQAANKKAYIDLDGIRALVVDDNETARNILASMLISFKIKVDTAGDGVEALVMLERAIEQEAPYDVVLLDWIMPGLDGIETAKRIKANSALAKVPAMLMVTANGREEAFQQADKVGLNAFLLKPVYASVMYDTLLDIVGIKTLPKALSVAAAKDTIDLAQIKGARILLVDDNVINQEVASELLEDAGMYVTVASNGRECLSALERSAYDLVFMDIQMPVMDGLEATRKIREHEELKTLPIVAMTAHAMAGDREKSLAAGMNEHITKPIDQTVLYKTLKDWIPERGSGNGPTLPITTKSLSNKERNSLPALPGINMADAFKAVDQNEKLLLKILHDFRVRYSALPANLRELSVTNKWMEIEEIAHTVKGVSGYIGASALMRHSQKLEDALRSNQQEAAANYLLLFINELDDVLSSLSLLPAPQSEKKAIGNQFVEKPVLAKDVKKDLALLIELLKKGEVTAEEQFVKVEKTLAGSGFDELLERIANLIEEIEYGSAGELAEVLHFKIQQQSEA